ncbi:MAG: transcription termination/antitermination protein NusG [Candidatus Midichloria sp.]
MSSDWYIVNTTSGCENKVAKAIREEAIKKGMSDVFEEIIVPTESYAEIRRGKKVDTKKKILPGYIIIKMHMNESAWGLVKRIPNVAKFLGADNRPAKVSEKEVERILKKVEEGSIAKDVPVSFELHEVIRITDGPFETFTGVIEEVDKEKLRLRVLVSILGREAPVELEFNQVEKI